MMIHRLTSFRDDTEICFGRILHDIEKQIWYEHVFSVLYIMKI